MNYSSQSVWHPHHTQPLPVVFIMVFDFTTGLKYLIPIPVLNQIQVESELKAIRTEPQYSDQPATLHWLEAILSPTREEVEALNIIDLARARQLHSPAPEVETADQPQPDYNCFTIRQLKKLARIAKIKHYGAMSKRQLIAALAAG